MPVTLPLLNAQPWSISLLVFMTSCVITGPCRPHHHHKFSTHLCDTRSAQHQVMQTTRALAKDIYWQSVDPRTGEPSRKVSWGLWPALPTGDRVSTCLPLPTMDQASWLSLGKGCFYGLVSLSQSQELLKAM